MTKDRKEQEAQLRSFEHELRTECEAQGISAKMANEVVGYVIEGDLRSGFLRAVMGCNFISAVLNADRENFKNLRGWARLLRLAIPRRAWGSSEKVSEWIKSDGLRGPR